jgi:hypothetical protein
MSKRILALAAVLVLAAPAVAEPPAANLQGVKRLVGKWSGTGTIKNEGKVFQAKATTECTEAAGGSGVRCKWTIAGIPNFTYVIEDLWGFSGHDGLVHWYAVTNGGEVHDHSGHLASSGGVLQFDGPMKGKTFSETIKFGFPADGRMTLDSECSLGGEPYEAVHLELSR